MTLKAQIQEDVKQAMKAREQAKLSTLRMLSAAIKQREVDERVELDDAAIIAIIEKQIKQRNEAALQFEQGGRSESALAEKAEVAVLSHYLPAQLTEVEVLELVRSTVTELAATGPQDMGKVMGKVKPVLAGRADMGKVSTLIKQVLSSQ